MGQRTTMEVDADSGTVLNVERRHFPVVN